MTVPSGASPSDATAPPDERREGSLWGLVLGASLMVTGMAAYEISPASVTPLIRDSMGIGATAAGLLVGVMFGSAVVTSLPAGAILDRTNTRRATAVAVLTLLLAGLWGWWAAVGASYLSLLASRVVAGAAFTVAWNAGIDIVSEAADQAHRATLLGIFTASGPLGFALGQGLSPAVASRWGWPVIFLAYHGVTIAGFAIFWSSSRGRSRASGSAPSPAEFGSVLRSRSVWLIGGLAFLGYGLYLFVNSWGPSYLTTELGLALGLSGLVVALFPAVGVVGRIGGGVLSDRIFGSRRRPVLLASFVIAAPLLATFTWLRSVPAVVTSLLLAGLAIQMTIGLSFAYVKELVDQRVGATAVAFLTTLGLGGAFVSPIVGGAVIDTAGYQVAFVAAGVLGAAGVVLAWRAREPA